MNAIKINLYVNIIGKEDVIKNILTKEKVKKNNVQN